MEKNIKTEHYLIEYHLSDDFLYETHSVMAESADEAVAVFNDLFPEAVVQNVFLEIKGNWS